MRTEAQNEWGRAKEVDLAVASHQLGRELEGRVVAVARRCSYGQPQVLVTYPLMHTTGRGRGGQRREASVCSSQGLETSPRWVPFPTVFWLTCPHVRGGVASLEGRGVIEEVRRRVCEDEAFGRAYEEANKRYASQRVSLLDAEDLARLQADGQPDEWWGAWQDAQQRDRQGDRSGDWQGMRVDGDGARARGRLVWAIAESGIGGISDWKGVKCLHMNVADYMAGNANPVGELCAMRLAEEGVGLECAEGRCVPARVAVINAGSNSAKALVAEVVERVGTWSGSRSLSLSRSRSRSRSHSSSHSSSCSRSCSLSCLRCRTHSHSVLHPGSGTGVFGPDIGGRLVFRVAWDSRITRLGRGLEQTGRLSEAGCAKTAEAIGEFVAMAREFGVSRIWATTTAAARRAAQLGDEGGVEELKQRVREAAGLELEVISPKLEAELSFCGAMAASGGVGDPRRTLVMDSGGMSTELIMMRGDGIHSVSLPIGAVSLTEQFVTTDPPDPSEIRAMREHVRNLLQGAGGVCDVVLADVISFMAVGGTAATLASISLGLEDIADFDYDWMSNFAVSNDEIEQLLARLVAVPFAERSRIKGMLEPERALVMPAGTAIILGAMDAVGAQQAVMSFAGILDGMAARLGGCIV